MLISPLKNTKQRRTDQKENIPKHRKIIQIEKAINKTINTTKKRLLKVQNKIN